jgi:hypothetical protein
MNFPAPEPLKFSPSEVVRVQPAAEKSGAVRSTAEDHWAALGFDLGGLLTEAWGMPESRMDIHSALDTSIRYDVVFAPPIPEQEANVLERVRGALQYSLQIIVTKEVRAMDIWVLTAPGAMTAYHPSQGLEVGARAVFCEPFDGSIPAPPFRNPTPGAVEAWLRSLLHRAPAIGMDFPETQLLPFSRGMILNVYDRGVGGVRPLQIEYMGSRTDEELASALHDDLGVNASKEHRSVEMLIVCPRPQ